MHTSCVQKQHTFCARWDLDASTSGRASFARQPRRQESRLQICHSYLPDLRLWREELPENGGYQIGVLKNVRSMATPRVSSANLIDRLRDTNHGYAKDYFGAFYSSSLGGIVVDPSCMMIHMDDKLVHSGYGVSQTIRIADGHLYLLEQQMEQLWLDAAKLGIPTTKSPESMLRIVLDTAAAGQRLNGQVKVWMTMGRGSFALSGLVEEPGFYVVATGEHQFVDPTAGWKVSVVPCPFRAEDVATIRPGGVFEAWSQLEAERVGADRVLFVDPDGHILSGPDAALALITSECKLLLPSIEDDVPDPVMQRLKYLAAELDCPDDLDLKGIEQRPITVTDVEEAAEAFITANVQGVVPVTVVGNFTPNDGVVGPGALALRALLELDVKNVDDLEFHAEIPYGYLTGMREQLT